MSTTLHEDIGSGVALTRFWGGAIRERCYQISGPDEHGKPSYVQLTAQQMAEIVAAWAKSL